MAAVARDCQGTIVDVITMKKQVSNATVAEAEAIRLSLITALKNRWTSILIESDNQLVMKHMSLANK